MSSVEKRLFKAFSKIASRNCEKMTVSELCEKAEVSRAGFYVHYKDIEDFYNRCQDYIINKLYEQMLIILNYNSDSSDSQLKIIFREDDIELLKAFTGKHSYMYFAEKANSIFAPKFKTLMIERWGEEYYKEKETMFEFALNGSVATLYFDLINFDKETFIKNMHYITSIMKELFDFK